MENLECGIGNEPSGWVHSQLGLSTRTATKWSFHAKTPKRQVGRKAAILHRSLAALAAQHQGEASEP